jgi:small subunit ribosomal protein S18
MTVEVVSKGAGTRRPFFRRRKSCPFSGAHAPKIDFKDVKLMLRFISERGKIVPSRITAVSIKKQRELAKAIKRARFLALLPFVVK